MAGDIGFNLNLTTFLSFLIQRIIQKTRFQSVPIAALFLYNIQRENLVFINLSVCCKIMYSFKAKRSRKKKVIFLMAGPPLPSGLMAIGFLFVFLVFK